MNYKKVKKTRIHTSGCAFYRISQPQTKKGRSKRLTTSSTRRIAAVLCRRPYIKTGNIVVPLEERLLDHMSPIRHRFSLHRFLDLHLSQVFHYCASYQLS